MIVTVNDMITKLKEKIKHHFQEVMKVKTSPHSIALGFAIGTLIAILPTFGLGILIGVLVVLIFEKVNKFSLLLSFVVFNTFTMIPLYLLSYKIGDLIFGSSPVSKYNIVILNQIYNFSRRYLIGNLIVAIVISTISYFIVKKIVLLYIQKKK